MLFYVKERAQRRLRDVQAAIYRERVPLAPTRFHQGNAEGAEAPDFDD